MGRVYTTIRISKALSVDPLTGELKEEMLLLWSE